MKWYKLISLVPVFAIVLVASSVHAETVLRITDSVALSDDQVVNGDFYSAAEKVSLSGTIAGDAHIAAGTVTTNGVIEQDLFVVSGTTQVHASVTDDVRIVGGEVTIAEYVGGDVFVLGGVLTVLSSARVDGNIFFYGGEAEINGSVGGSIYGTSDKLRIDGPVGGDVNVDVGNALVLGDRADIGGGIQYSSRNELVRAQKAVVVGDITKNTMREAHQTDPRQALIPFLMYAFSVMVVFAVFRNRLGDLMNETSLSFTKNGLVGLAIFVFLPFAIALSFATIIGMLVGITAFFAMGFLYLFALLLVPIFLGVLLNQSFAKSRNVTLLWTLLGVLGVAVLASIPVVGGLVLFALFAVMLGVTVKQLYRSVIS